MISSPTRYEAVMWFRLFISLSNYFISFMFASGIDTLKKIMISYFIVYT
jgi:hypothetical protein